MLMAGTFIMPQKQKALGQKWAKEEKGIKPNSYSYS